MRKLFLAAIAIMLIAVSCNKKSSSESIVGTYSMDLKGMMEKYAKSSDMTEDQMKLAEGFMSQIDIKITFKPDGTMEYKGTGLDLIKSLAGSAGESLPMEDLKFTYRLENDSTLVIHDVKKDTDETTILKNIKKGYEAFDIESDRGSITFVKE